MMQEVYNSSSYMMTWKKVHCNISKNYRMMVHCNSSKLTDSKGDCNSNSYMKKSWELSSNSLENYMNTNNTHSCYCC